MTENEFILQDRIAKIKSMNDLYDLENNSYISFSGGKDSTVLSHLIDFALPNNQIPRVYVDTYLDYKLMRKYVMHLAENDSRIIIINHGKNIRDTLESDGYPFKSKSHAKIVMYRQNNKTSDYIDFYFHKTDDYDGKATRRCPSKLLYQYDFNDFKISSECCINMKEKPLLDWQKANRKKIYMTGMRSAEGGRRATKSGCITMNGKNIRSFNPLFVVSDDFVEWYIRENNILLCELYYEPYNMKRTGCKGCPFTLELQSDLDLMEKLLPQEKKQCEILWNPVYQEYRKVGYRLRNNIQPEFNF